MVGENNQFRPFFLPLAFADGMGPISSAGGTSSGTIDGVTDSIPSGVSGGKPGESAREASCIWASVPGMVAC